MDCHQPPTVYSRELARFSQTIILCGRMKDHLRGTHFTAGWGSSECRRAVAVRNKLPTAISKGRVTFPKREWFWNKNTRDMLRWFRSASRSLVTIPRMVSAAVSSSTLRGPRLLFSPTPRVQLGFARVSPVQLFLFLSSLRSWVHLRPRNILE